MKKWILILFACLSMALLAQQAMGADLSEVYQSALKNDPQFKEAIAQRMSAAEAVPQSRAALLPQLNFSSSAGYTRIHSSGQNAFVAGINVDTVLTSQRQLNYSLNLTQSIFNYSNWKAVSAAKNTVKAANAVYYAAAQNLMSRTLVAYFTVLQRQDILRYTAAEKRALYQEYIRAKENFKVGLKTITDVYNAKASYDTSVAQYIGAKHDVATAKEDLRAITSTFYKHLAPLSKKFPLVAPNPKDIDQWVQTASQQNWQLTAARYTALAAKEQIKQYFGGHLPTLDLSAGYSNTYLRDSGTISGRGRIEGPSAQLALTVPLYSGGLVSSQVRKAIADYENYSSQQGKTYREVMNNTRKNYLAIIAGISQVQADRQTVISAQSSLEGTQEGYKIGTRTIVDVLDAQKILYNAQKTYAIDRYSYIVNTISLKETAGTLSEEDLKIINTWLIKDRAATRVVNAKRVKSKPIKHEKLKAKKTAYFLQAAAFKNQAEADAVAEKIHHRTKLTCKVYSGKHKAVSFHRVRVGPIYNKEILNQATGKLKAMGFEKPLIITKKA